MFTRTRRATSIVTLAVMSIGMLGVFVTATSWGLTCTNQTSGCIDLSTGNPCANTYQVGTCIELDPTIPNCDNGASFDANGFVATSITTGVGWGNCTTDGFHDGICVWSPAPCATGGLYVITLDGNGNPVCQPTAQCNTYTFQACKSTDQAAPSCG